MSERRILIVDDSAVFRISMKKILASMKAEIILAQDGQEGLDLALQEKFDIKIQEDDISQLGTVNQIAEYVTHKGK